MVLSPRNVLIGACAGVRISRALLQTKRFSNRKTSDPVRCAGQVPDSVR